MYPPFPHVPPHGPNPNPHWTDWLYVGVAFVLLLLALLVR